MLRILLPILLILVGPSASDGRIAYGCAGEICVTNVDGSGRKQLTNNDFGDHSPQWSPDAKKILFQRVGPGELTDIYVMNADGTHEVNLSDNQAPDGMAEWSPDGSKIVFVREWQVGPIDFVSAIYVMNADGSGQTQLTDLAEYYAWPTWSPNGTRIAYYGAIGGVEVEGGLFVMDADGSNPTKIAQEDVLPTWSPDGSRIAYVCTWDEPGLSDRYAICLVDPDGSDLSRIAASGWLIDSEPLWSPDGTRLAFSRLGPDASAPTKMKWDVYTVNMDGSGLTNLSQDPSSASRPAWSQDGRWIAYEAWRDGDVRVFVMDADGGQQVNIGGMEEPGSSPAWAPLPQSP